MCEKNICEIDYNKILEEEEKYVEKNGDENLEPFVKKYFELLHKI